MELEILIGLILDGLVVIGGFSAIGIYIHQKYVEKKTAATLILEQIDEIESAVKPLQEYYKKYHRIDDREIYISGEIPCDGAWQKYQNLFIKNLNEADRTLIQTFFNSAYRIEKSRLDTNDVYHITWNSKSIAWQYYAGESLKTKEDITSAINNFYAQTGCFTPKLVNDTMTSEIASFVPLSGTIAYEKLLKKSYRKH